MQYLSEWDDFIINESFGYEDLKKWIKTQIVKNLSYEDLVSKVKKVLNQVKLLPKKTKTTIMISLITTILTFKNSDQLLKIAEEIKNLEFLELVKLNEPNAPKSTKKFSMVDNLTISERGKNLIKRFEFGDVTPESFEAIDIGDGKITIGWGHAEPKGKSKYKLGQKITSEEADKLFEEDINKVEKEVKNKWKKSFRKIGLTQDMYDVIISIAYHKGVDGLFKGTKFIKYLKKGDYETAGQLIKTEYDKKRVLRYPGWKKRREKESELFLSYLGSMK